MQRPSIGSILRLSAVPLMTLALVASATAPKPHTIDKTMRTEAGFDQTWSALIEVFADRNWAIQNMAKDSGLITTEWMSIGGDSSFADCGGAGIASVKDREIRFNVFVRDADGGAVVTVNATFREVRSFDGRVFNVDCTSTGQVERLIHRMVDEGLVGRDSRRPRAPEPAPTPERAPSPPDPSSSDAPPGSGTLGGRCYGNQTCNAGLECDDIVGRCVLVEPQP